MPFNITLTPEGAVEATIGRGAQKQVLRIDCDGAPWSRTVLGQPLISATLEAWMRSAVRPAQVSWTVIEEMLETSGLGQPLRASYQRPNP